MPAYAKLFSRVLVLGLPFHSITTMLASVCDLDQKEAGLPSCCSCILHIPLSQILQFYNSPTHS
jgi:hypothetical protein